MEHRNLKVSKIYRRLLKFFFKKLRGILAKAFMRAFEKALVKLIIRHFKPSKETFKKVLADFNKF